MGNQMSSFTEHEPSLFSSFLFSPSVLLDTNLGSDISSKIYKMKSLLCLLIFSVNHHLSSKQWRDRLSEKPILSLLEKCKYVLFIFLSHKVTPGFLISWANEYIVYLLTLKLHQPHLNSELLTLDVWLWASQAIFSPQWSY